jgi:distribution and morphology protein 10
MVQYDEGWFGVESLASTDGGLLGVRGLYNFGGDASATAPTSAPTASSPAVDEGGSSSNGNGHGAEKERIYGRFSVGGELYYGTLNKSGGVSVGARFATLPAHRGSPLTATLTVNPLMGNISATYAVQAQRYCSLATRMDFNVYSYESDWKVGMELWSRRRPGGFLLGVEPDAAALDQTTSQQTRPDEAMMPRKKERSFQAKLEWRLDDDESPVLGNSPGAAEIGSEYLGVLKARVDQHLRLALLWEGRVKSLIFSLGSGVDLRRLDQPFSSLGLEIQYSS